MDCWIELGGTGERLRYNDFYTATNLPLLIQIDSLFRKDYMLAGFVEMALEDAGVSIARSLAYFPRFEGMPYWTGVEFRIPGFGQVALLLPGQTDYENGWRPIVLVQNHMTPQEKINALLQKILDTVTEKHIEKFKPKEE